MSSQPIAPEAEVGVEQLFAELEAKVREYRPKDDLAPLEKAFRFASDHHSRQKRDSGEPYMNHPLLVSHSLADMRMDLVCIETGLLHDVVEDTGVTDRGDPQEFRRRGGPLRRRRHQARQAGFLLRRGPPGRELPQDAAGDGGRYPRHHRQAGRPAPQYAHARFSVSRAPAAHRQRDAGDLRAHRAPARHGQSARRARGSGVPLYRPRSLRRRDAQSRNQAARQRRAA